MTEVWTRFAFDDQGHERKFKNFDTFDQWIVQESLKWNWLRSAGGPYGNVGEQMASAFGTLRQQAANTRANGGTLTDMIPTVESHYSDRGWLRHSEGILANKINQVRERYGDSAAAFVFGFHKGQVGLNSASDPAHIAAIVTFSMPDIAAPSEIAARLQRERANYRAAISASLERLDEADSVTSDRTRKRTLRAIKFFTKELRRSRAINDTLHRALSSAMNDAIASIRGVEEGYRTAMGLQAPVEYWRTKAAGHQIAERVAFNRLLWFFPIAFLVFAISFAGAAALLLQSDSVHQTVYIIVAAGLAALAALIFWIGRLLTKLYLSQQHLRHDAEERAVMTTTYLALTHESAATEEDKKIILAALFRPTVDGLVKDEGPSDLTLAGMLSKVGVGR
ncbi:MULTISPECIES: DUF6161 domain-containing protein [Sphingobium]|nr:DUF6161 domain-containing protein [Sphingobium indicum]